MPLSVDIGRSADPGTPTLLDIDKFLVNTIRQHRQTQLDLAYVFRRFNIEPPPITPTFTPTATGPRFARHLGLANAMTELASRANLDLPGIITHVHFWSDNLSTMSWLNQRLTTNRSSQGINRLVGLCEAAFQLHVTAGHLPGICNRLSDAGSHAHINSNFASIWKTGTIGWIETLVLPDTASRAHINFNFAMIWKTGTIGWIETLVPSSFRSSLLTCMKDSFAPPLPRPHTAATPSPGANGSSGAAANVST